jgi:putative ABC transport system ATP-binding protein
MSGESVLELDGVTKVYGEQPPVPALRGVSFSVRRGELVAIVGPSGSGKSTLLHVIGTLERPSNGVVRIGGVDAARLSDRELSLLRAREIGFVFQQFFLAEHATVRENVADGLLYAGVPAAERYRCADEALERVGLAERAKFKPTKLSGGERQRVAIARALVGRPARRRTDREPRQTGAVGSGWSGRARCFLGLARGLWRAGRLLGARFTCAGGSSRRRSAPATGSARRSRSRPAVGGDRVAPAVDAEQLRPPRAWTVQPEQQPDRRLTGAVRPQVADTSPGSTARSSASRAGVSP